MNGLHNLVIWFNDPLNWQGADGIPTRLGEHLVLWAWSLAISCAIGIPGGIWVGRSKRSGTAAVNAANIGRAIPSFAVLVLGVIWLGLGNAPVLIALVLLAVPPIFTYTYTAVRQVDPETVEGARGMGMTEWRVVRSVQLPLALPLILDGIRLASATILATATLAAIVAGGGLGRFIVRRVRRAQLRQGQRRDAAGRGAGDPERGGVRGLGPDRGVTGGPSPPHGPSRAPDPARETRPGH